MTRQLEATLDLVPPMADGLVAGVDCSTQGTKVLVIEPATGRVLAEGRAAHEVVGRDGARESDPNGWWTALRDALAATGLAGSVRAISIAGQQHGLVVLAEPAPGRAQELSPSGRATFAAAWRPSIRAWVDARPSALSTPDLL